MPAGLRPSAETGAARFGGDARVRRQYFDNFRRGALDALIWADQIDESRRDSANACAAGKEPQLRTIECAYADGIAAVAVHGATTTLEDFGYQVASVLERVAVQADSQLRYVEVKHQKPWLLAPSPVVDGLTTGNCYRLSGYATGVTDAARYPGSRGSSS